ncbi:MAG: SDR family oxidoreductase [Xanthomonadales bacterium]|nr:SDR family oxidoreductase [Xanthomonadales bacterium]
MSNKETALITGASAGIGRELAMVFAEQGHDLILVARRKPELDALAGSLTLEHEVDVSVQAADLSVDGAADSLFDTLADQPVDILVNNAGVLSGGWFLKMDQQAIDNMIRVNMLALTALCRRFMAPMLERGSGRVLNIASIAAFQPVPSLAVYAATKAYVLSLSEALAVETEKKGISVTAVCPGFTDTDMLHGMDGEKSGVPDLAVLSPREVARDAYAACMAGEAIKVPGLGYALTTMVAGALPRWVLRRVGSLAIHSGRKG